MQRSIRYFLSMTVILAANVSLADEEASRSFFETQIRPILVEYCYECHSADADEIMGGLRVDSRGSLLKGGDTGPAVVPGEADGSLLLKAIRYNDRNLQMPPDNPLPKEVVSHFETWIANGAYDARVAQKPGQEV